VIEPLAFTLEALASRGALVDPTPEGALALLPANLARALGTAEDIRLTQGAPGEGLVGCGFGTPLLDRLIQDARASAPVAWVRVNARAPGIAQAESVAGRLVLRNGPLDVLDATPSQELYLSAFFSVTAEADDRYETLCQVVFRPDGAGEPDPALAVLLDPRRSAHRFAPADAESLADLAPLIPRARSAAEGVLAAFRDAVRRRCERDRARLEEYFASLMADARNPRRSVAPEAIAAKLAHLEAEREQKLRDLGPRYAIKMTLAAAAFVCARFPAVRVRLRARRRKAEREIIVVVPPEARSPDRLPCAVCQQPTLRPVACDDQLHLLCETCSPGATGRVACGACRSRR